MEEEKKVEEVKQEVKQEVESTEGSGLAVSSLILGIIALLLSLIPIVNNFAFVLAIVGGILGIIALVKKQKKVMSIISLVLAGVAIILVLASQAFYGKVVDDMIDIFEDFSQDIDNIFADKTEEILANELDVVMGKFVIEEDGYFTDTKLELVLTNKSSERKSFSVQVEAIDSEGNRIDDDTGYASNLSPGQKTTIKLFNFVLSEKIPELKNAEFKIIEVSAY